MTTLDVQHPKPEEMRVTDTCTPVELFMSLSIKEAVVAPAAGGAVRDALVSSARHTEKGSEWPSAAQTGIC